LSSDDKSDKGDNNLKTVLIVSLGDTRSWMKPWIDQIDTHFPVRVHLLNSDELGNNLPLNYDRFIFTGKSLLLYRENIARICAAANIDPLRVFSYPEEHLPQSMDDEKMNQWNSYLHQVILAHKAEQPVEAINLQLIKKVAVLGMNPIDDSILEEFQKVGLEIFQPIPPFTIKRQGIQYCIESQPGATIVGGVVVVPDFQPVFSYPIPSEVDDTRKVLFLEDFKNKVLLRNFRKQTVVFLVPEVMVPAETWSTLYDLSQLLVQRDQAQVFILCREVVVAGDGLEKKYLESRKAGVLIEKIDFSHLVLQPSLDMRGSWISFVTERDRISQKFLSDWMIKVPGKKVIPYDLTKIFFGDRLIPFLSPSNNINLPLYSLPLDGWYHLPDNKLTIDTRYAIQEVVDYLQQEVTAEKNRAIVDEERCVLCLTCLRTCPWSAIDIEGSSKRKKARINWEQCHLCGLCSTSCPAGAITLYGLEMDKTVTTQAE
jgi:NAD-dependent dihydropyrimidine dehydrogenase PreA subunit